MSERVACALLSVGVLSLLANTRDLRLDTFFFSCLGLAKSAYYIIKDDQGGRYKDAIHSWRMNVLNQKSRTQFNRMMNLRDNDVHRGDPTEKRFRR